MQSLISRTVPALQPLIFILVLALQVWQASQMQGQLLLLHVYALACRREANASALQEKTADEMSTMYIRTVERELQKYRYVFLVA